MSRKKTVKIIYDSVKVQIDKHFRSNVVFCLAMGFEDRPSWVSDLKRGRNLPSPEEAARMCVLLQTTPEEILVEEADIELVRSLIEQERENGIKKERPADGEARVCDLPESIQKIINICLDRPELASALLTLAQQIEKG